LAGAAAFVAGAAAFLAGAAAFLAGAAAFLAGAAAFLAGAAAFLAGAAAFFAGAAFLAGVFAVAMIVCPFFEVDFHQQKDGVFTGRSDANGKDVSFQGEKPFFSL
jgi:membrane protein implicated in regulation of membrane protease activity